jgi:hypothetical protein
LINRYSVENVVDMPDFLLAEMICRMIEATGSSVKKTLDWHGCDSVCHHRQPGALEGRCVMSDYGDYRDVEQLRAECSVLRARAEQVEHERDAARERIAELERDLYEACAKLAEAQPPQNAGVGVDDLYPPPEPPSPPCPRCGGSGNVAKWPEWTTCPHCGGKGR